METIDNKDIEYILGIKGRVLRKGDLEYFKKTCNLFRKAKYNFYEVSNGGISKIILNGRVYGIYFDKYKDNKLAIACSMVAREANSFLKKNNYAFDNNIYYPIIDYNIKQIHKNKKSFVTAIDMKACYWRIAYNKGFISKKVFEKYYDDKEARLISFGALNKNFTIKKYENGIYKHSRIKAKTWVFWNEVLKEINTMYYELVGIIGLENYYMWLTDCIYFNPSQTLVVMNYFNGLNIPFRTLHIEFNEIVKGNLAMTILNRFPEEKKMINLPDKK